MEKRLGPYVRAVAVYLTLCVMAISACHAENPHPIQWTLTARTAELPLRKGSVVRTILHAKIMPGWHLYAMEQQSGGPTATRISLSPDQTFGLNGAIESETPPIVMNDPNFNLETRYFEGDASFHIPVKAISAVSAALTKLTVDVFFQTCNDRLCLPATVVHMSTQIRRRH